MSVFSNFSKNFPDDATYEEIVEHYVALGFDEQYAFGQIDAFLSVGWLVVSINPDEKEPRYHKVQRVDSVYRFR